MLAMQAQAFELGTAAVAIWWATLALTVLVFVPLALHLLHRTWRAAAQIKRYTERSLEAASGIAGNTGSTEELVETVELVGQLSATTGEIGQRAGALVETLLGRTARRGVSGGGGRAGGSESGGTADDRGKRGGR